MDQLVSMIREGQSCSVEFLHCAVCAGTFWYHGSVVFITLWQRKDLCDSGLICFPSFPLAPFLCHPNLWIRYGAVGFITVVAHQISTADVYCKLMPYLDPYITQPVIQVHVFQLMPVLSQYVSRVIHQKPSHKNAFKQVCDIFIYLSS